MLEIDDYGNRYWYNENGLKSRSNGPACEYWDGSKEWYINGELHREDGPAVECIDRSYWYKNGKYHRIGGPAWEYSDGTKEWWLEGILYSENSYNEKVKEYVEN